MKRHLALLALFGALAVLMTWPLLPNLRYAVPHPGDPYIMTWVLDWDVWSLAHRPLGLFHANVFHPLPYTLAFTENVVGIALVLALLFALGLAPLTIYNLATLLGFALAGYAAALLGRHITGSTLAGIAGGIFFAFVPWRFTHLTHLQHLWTLWLPLLVLALLRLMERSTPARTAALAAAFAMNGLTNLHWFAFGSVAIGLCTLVCACFAAEWKRFLAASAIAFACGLVLVGPVLYPYWRAGEIYHLRGDAGETLGYSATTSDWLIASEHNRLWGPLTNDGSVDPERWSFPGLVAPLLAIGAIVAMAERPRRERAAVNVGALLAALGFLGSLGLHTPFGRFLFEHVPPFHGIRVPARWAMVAYLGLAMLVSIATALLARHRAIGAAICIALLLELRAAPIRYYLVAPEPSPVARWLATQPRGTVVAELPMDQEHVYRYLFDATAHHLPMIDGVSGFKPSDYAALEELAAKSGSDSPELLSRLRARGATLLVVHGQQEDRVVPWSPPGAPRTFPATAGIQGAMTHPLFWERVEGPLVISGWAASPAGIRSIAFLFDNRRVRVPASIDASAHFNRTLPRRPAAIRADTDLVVEVTGGDGSTRLLPQAWLRWQNPGERLYEGQLPQTAELGKYRLHPAH
ncbi:MAG TPA: hypothetical protein VN605_03805 [Thermoanaerobaculia bacterium]|nr:hypothetical protein [Thermoanaerobaculia bacterium]